jgi:predicted PurR-regulated permease PerM
MSRDTLLPDEDRSLSRRGQFRSMSSRRSKDRQTHTIHLPTAQTTLQLVQTEKQALERILKPPRTRLSRCLCVTTSLILAVSLLLVLVFFSSVAVLHTRRGVAKDILSQVEFVGNISAVSIGQLNDVSSEIDMLSDGCLVLEQYGLVMELIDQSLELTGNLQELLSTGNFVGPSNAIENTSDDTVVLTLTFAVICMQLTLGSAAFLSSVMSCCLFRWGDSRVICNRTSIMAYNVTLWMLAISVPVAWITLGGLAVVFAAVSDDCWGPSLYMSSGGQRFRNEGVDVLTKDNFLYQYNFTSPNMDGSWRGGDGFNLASFFFTCRAKFRVGDFVDETASDVVQGGSETSSQFNPFESLVVRAGWQVDALFELLAQAGTCADQARADTKSVLTTLAKQHPFLTCSTVSVTLLFVYSLVFVLRGVTGRHMANFGWNTCLR